MNDEKKQKLKEQKEAVSYPKCSTCNLNNALYVETGQLSSLEERRFGAGHGSYSFEIEVRCSGCGQTMHREVIGKNYNLEIY